jgi:uncharacterized membrane protein
VVEFLKLYALSFASLFALDMLWLVKIAPNLYKSQIGHLMAEKANLVAAALFYIIYITGVVVFVVQPAFEKASLSYALGRGALFGFVAYATFDLTSMSVLKNWPAKITIIDMIWGTLLTAGVAGLAVALATKILK